VVSNPFLIRWLPYQEAVGLAAARLVAQERVVQVVVQVGCAAEAEVAIYLLAHLFLVEAVAVHLATLERLHLLLEAVVWQLLKGLGNEIPTK